MRAALQGQIHRAIYAAGLCSSEMRLRSDMNYVYDEMIHGLISNHRPVGLFQSRYTKLRAACYCSSHHSHFLQDLQEHAALTHKHLGQSGRVPVTRCCLSSAARRLCPSLPPSPAQRERVAVAHAAADGDGGDDTARLTRPPQQRISKRPCRRSAPLAAYPPPWACRRAG